MSSTIFEAEKLHNDPFFPEKEPKLTEKRKNAALNGGTAHALDPHDPMPPQRHCEQQQAPHDHADAATTRGGAPATPCRDTGRGLPRREAATRPRAAQGIRCRSASAQRVPCAATAARAAPRHEQRRPDAARGADGSKIAARFLPELRQRTLRRSQMHVATRFSRDYRYHHSYGFPSVEMPRTFVRKIYAATCIFWYHLPGGLGAAAPISDIKPPRNEAHRGGGTNYARVTRR